MTCDRYREFWLGGMSADDFAAHRESCVECDAAVAMDEIVEHEAGLLPVPTGAPGLWDRIAAAARAEAQGKRPARSADRHHRFRGSSLTEAFPGGFLGLAAVLVVCVGLGAALILRSDGSSPAPGNLLAAEALARVESLETEYVAAIRDLETLAAPMLATADTRLLLRYRERLEIIDDQIRDCRAMLANDGANAHVRRYLLAAYQDKTDTLTELLALADG